MAHSNSKPSQFQLSRLHFVALRIAVFLLLVHSGNTISFDISCFHNNSEVVHQGDSETKDCAIQLTAGSSVRKYQSGRALYRQPMHLWDKATGKLTDFSTKFTFALNSTSSDYLPGDGLAFFLVPNGSFIPPNSSGGFLGLLNGVDPSNSTKNPFVAVEFDNHIDSWDPNVEHLGIDINSIQSAIKVKWCWNNNKSFSAAVHYSATRKALCVVMIDGADYSDLTGSSTLCKVVDLRDYLPEWVNIGFSASTRDLPQTHKIYSWLFNSSLEETGHRKRKKTKQVVGSAIGACAALSVIIGFIFVWMMLPRKRDDAESKDDGAIVDDSSIDVESVRGSAPRRFSYSELEKATNKFSEQGKLGEGGFGGVYRGFLVDLNQDIAVKRYSKGSKQGRKEYKSEVKIIGSLRHRNLVQLVGWCHEREELLLVYEFMPNGSLHSHLFCGKSMLPWVVRYKIALGLASALLYLHEEWEQCVVHRDIKASNVMLDANFNAKLGDFGLARLIDHELGSKTTGPAGTLGYIAPEYINTGKPSKETDMYSFGILALEIACGRRAIEPDIEESGIALVSWVWELYGNGNLFDAVDQKLNLEFDVRELERLLIVGIWCAHPDHKLRASIRQAIQVLNFEASAPDLPTKMPVPMYQVPSSSTNFSRGPLMTFTSFNAGR